jgi:peptidoglycan/LPS O-acetylase OafA/YrhL
LADSAASVRLPAFDYLRGFVVMLVVFHHSVLAYCRYGHFDKQHYLWSSAPIVDTRKFLGFDLMVLFNDGYFMPLMFLLSGLFVWPGLARKGSVEYCRDRARRLGLPFAIAVLTVIPLAWYPSFRMTGSTAGFGHFWAETIFAGPWPSGPAWFLAVLLAFDVVVALIHGAPGAPRYGPTMPGPSRCFALLALVSAVAYLPMLGLFGPSYWFSFGPIAVQASRVGLYGVYFLAGVLAGSRGPGSFVDFLSRVRWTWWSLLALVLFGCLVAVVTSRLTSGPVIPPLARLALYGCSLVLFCAAANFALFGIFSHFARRSFGLGDSLANNAYGIYILHYPAVTWTQYVLLDADLPAILKAALVFFTALSLSWLIAMLVRRVPGVARVI